MWLLPLLLLLFLLVEEEAVYNNKNQRELDTAGRARPCLWSGPLLVARPTHSKAVPGLAAFDSIVF